MITMHKKYKTRDGQEVRLLCIDGPSSVYPVIGIIDNMILKWGSSGQFIDPESWNDLDLIEVPNTKQLTFYRRKWFLHREDRFVTAGHSYCPTKENFDEHYGVPGAGTWSDEWETIVVEVSCEG